MYLQQQKQCNFSKSGKTCVHDYQIRLQKETMTA